MRKPINSPTSLILDNLTRKTTVQDSGYGYSTIASTLEHIGFRVQGDSLQLRCQRYGKSSKGRVKDMKYPAALCHSRANGTELRC